MSYQESVQLILEQFFFPSQTIIKIISVEGILFITTAAFFLGIALLSKTFVSNHGTAIPPYVIAAIAIPIILGIIMALEGGLIIKLLIPVVMVMKILFASSVIALGLQILMRPHIFGFAVLTVFVLGFLLIINEVFTFFTALALLIISSLATSFTLFRSLENPPSDLISKTGFFLISFTLTFAGGSIPITILRAKLLAVPDKSYVDVILEIANIVILVDPYIFPTCLGLGMFLGVLYRLRTNTPPLK